MNFFALGSIAQNSIIEDSIQIVFKDPLIVLCENNDSTGIKNFSTFNFENYSTNNDIEFQRRTSLSSLSNVQPNFHLLNVQLNPTSIIVDTQTFVFEGYFDAKLSDQNFTLIHVDSFFNCKKMKLIEHVFITTYGDTVASYLNTYYIFYQDQISAPLIEIFECEQTLKGNIGYIYKAGISDNSIVPIPDIQLSVTPNPAEDFVNISFTLPNEDAAIITIANQTGSYFETIASDYFDAGENITTFQLNNKPTGIYTISVLYQGNNYNSTLIIQ